MMFHLPHYFSSHLRRQVKELYAATAIMDVAVAAMLIFEPIYLYSELNLSIEKILLFFAAVYFWYIVLIPLGGKFASRFGYKHSIIASIPMQIVYWGCLFFARSLPELVWVAPLFYGLQKAFYWPAFHATVARFAGRKQVGREFGVLTVIIQLTHILGPLAGGLIAVKFGGGSLFIAAILVYLLSIFPLVKHRERGERAGFQFSDTVRLYETETRRAWGYFGFGEELVALTVWHVYLFVALKDYGSVGVVATIASGLAILISLWMGKLSDLREKFVLIKRGTFLAALSWFVRPLLPSGTGVLVADTFGRVAKNAYFIPIAAVTYERAENDKILPYVIFFEQSLAIGKLLTALLCALLFALTGSFVVLFIVAGVISLLYMLL